ncbi:hypothetical protein D9M68_609840 [compost metagenome]
MPGQRDGGVLRADQGEEIRTGHELLAGQCIEFHAETFGETQMGVDPRANRRPSLRQPLQARQQRTQMQDVGLDLLGPTIQHLAHAHRHGIHQVGTPGFHIGLHLQRLVAENGEQVTQRRQQLPAQFDNGTDMDGGGNDVVAALPAIDVVVGADLVAENAAGQGGDHFVGIHVGTGAGAGLEHIDREMLHEVS